LKKVYRVTDEEYNRHMGHVIETLEIGPLLDKPVRKLSLGQRMRCELAAALIHNPPLLFLDEPTIGLDVLVKLKIREFLKEINEQYKTTILLTTHDLTDIEALCERVVLLDEGKIIYDGKLSNLQSQAVEGKQIEFEFLSEMARSSLPAKANVQWEQKNATTWLCHINGDEKLVSQLISEVVQKNPIKNVKINEVSTEEIVRKIYEEGMAIS
jgi:ABC-2 type transport system ATP-binding protein